MTVFIIVIFFKALNVSVKQEYLLSLNGLCSVNQHATFSDLHLVSRSECKIPFHLEQSLISSFFIYCFYRYDSFINLRCFSAGHDLHTFF